MRVQSKTKTLSFLRKNLGFSLVEVTMAIGLVSFCMVALMGLLPVGLKQERKATDQVMALQALNAVVTDFRNAQTGATKTKVYGIDIPRQGENSGVGTLNLNGSLASIPGVTGKEFEVTYKLEPPVTRFSSYRFSVRVARTSQDSVASKIDSSGVDYVESVVLKPNM